MSDVMSTTTTKRGPGRPRKQAVKPDEPIVIQEPAAPVAAGLPPAAALPPVVAAPPPLTDTDIEMIDRKGAAKLLGKSPMTIAWLESNDPDFPAPFTLGKNNFYFLTNDLRAYVLKKAAQAKALKQQRMQPRPKE
jgi:predicted DNA-binding transcriptional regulator AlpA